MPTWSVKTNEAGNEVETEEVLFTGLTAREASAKVRSLYNDYNIFEAPDDLADGIIVNFFVTRED